MVATKAGASHQSVQSVEKCMLCGHYEPFGCTDCKKEQQKDESRQAKVYIGSGEDLREWSFA